jgi:hypothetical protein
MIKIKIGSIRKKEKVSFWAVFLILLFLQKK